MKKRICLLLALVMTLCMVSVSSVSAATLTAEPVYVYINNEPLKIEEGRMGALLFKETGSTMVPLRAISEAFGCDVEYNEKTEEIDIKNDLSFIRIKVNSDIMLKIDRINEHNIEEIKLPVPPIVLQGTTLVPARAISEAFHATVKWDDPTRRVDLIMPYDAVGFFYEGVAVVTKGGKQGAVNELGQLIIPVEYEKVELCNEGYIPVKYRGKWGAIDINGNLVVPVKYDGVSAFKYGHAVVHSNGMAGLVNAQGEVVIPIQFDRDMGVTPYDGYSVVKKNNKYGVYTNKGKEIVYPYYDYIWEFTEGVAEVQKYGKRGYIDLSGDEIVPTEFEDVRPFKDGLARVMIYEETKDGVVKKFGFYNDKGREVVPVVYDDAHEHYNEGLVGVKKGDSWGFLDTTGKSLNSGGYGEVSYFNEGYARVKRGDKYGYIDATGKQVINVDFVKAGDFHEGVAYAISQKRSGEKTIGYLNNKGIWSFTHTYSEYMGDFHEGLARVFDANGKAGFVDQTGKVVIPFEYEDARDFSEGYVAVCKDGKWGYIDRNNNIIVDFKYAVAQTFENHVAVVQTQKDGEVAPAYILCPEVERVENGTVKLTQLSSPIKFPKSTVIVDRAGNKLTLEDFKVGDKLIINAKQLGSNFVGSRIIVQR